MFLFSSFLDAYIFHMRYSGGLVETLGLDEYFCFGAPKIFLTGGLWRNIRYSSRTPYRLLLGRNENIKKK